MAEQAAWTVKAGTVDLDRFRLEGVLGEGADLQVFAATDGQSRRPVVLKRPHPTLIQRRRHQDVERKLELTVELREDLGDALPHVSPLIGCSAVEPHDEYFEDALEQPYLVVAEERAQGLPLVGSAVDGVKRRPIGLPQNLFALHPLQEHPDRGAFSIIGDILDIAEALYGAGHLLLDVLPHNVYFDPLSARITLIDMGGVTVERPAGGRRAPVDLHDLYMELFKWYTTPGNPPEDAAGYTAPHGMGSVASFTRDLARMKLDFSSQAPEPLRSAAVEILDRIGARAYAGFADFRRDFEPYLEMSAERYGRLSESPDTVGTWRKALAGLRDVYWEKFLFDAKRDLAPYRVPCCEEDVTVQS